MLVSVVMVVIVSVSMVVPMIVVVVMVVSMQMFMGYAFPVGMSRNMTMVMLVVVLVSMLFHNTVHCVFFNVMHVLHGSASFRKGAYSRVFRTAADLFQVSDFFCHNVNHLSLRLSPGLRELRPSTTSQSPSLISLPG